MAISINGITVAGVGAAGKDGKSAYDAAKAGGYTGTEEDFNTLLANISSSASGKRICRFTVGTRTTGWTESDCDYLCDGTDDQSEINAAIQALPSSGGEIIILDGTYNITAAITMNKDNVKLSGNGNATVLKRMWNSSIKEGIITISPINGGCCVLNLCVDGNKSSYTSSNNSGIYLYGNSSNNTITSNTCNNNYNGIDLYGSNSTITSNTCNNNNSGIYLYGNNSAIIGNTCNYNNNKGIYLAGSSSTIIGNTCIQGTGKPSDYADSQYTIKTSGTNNLITGNNIMGKNYVDEGTNNTFTNNKYN